MSQIELFTEAEFAGISALAIEGTWAKCRKDPAYLRTLIRSRRELPTIAAEAVYEQAQTDSGYLRDLIREHVKTLTEFDVLALLKENQGDVSATEQLGFDPFDPQRAEAFEQAVQAQRQAMKRANRSVRVKQGVVLALAIMTFTLTGLFPPWVEITTRKTFRLVFIIPVWSSAELSRKFVGYDYAFATKSSHQVGSGNEDHGNTTWTDEVTYHYDVRTLTLQWLALLVVVVVALLILRPRKAGILNAPA